MEEHTNLRTVRFVAKEYNLPELAKILTNLKALASRTPTPVTVEQLEAIDQAQQVAVLLLQKSEEQVVGMVHVSINVLEDRAHLGPIAVDKSLGGWGTPLMQDTIAYIKEHFPQLRRIDLTNRASHDLSVWYKKFGFVPRTKEAGDPSTVYRLNI